MHQLLPKRGPRRTCPTGLNMRRPQALARPSSAGKGRMLTTRSRQLKMHRLPAMPLPAAGRIRAASPAAPQTHPQRSPQTACSCTPFPSCPSPPPSSSPSCTAEGRESNKWDLPHAEKGCGIVGTDERNAVRKNHGYRIILSGKGERGGAGPAARERGRRIPILCTRSTTSRPNTACSRWIPLMPRLVFTFSGQASGSGR